MDMEKTNVLEENGGQSGSPEVKQEQQENGFSREQVNEIVQKRTARYAEKNSKLVQELESAKVNSQKYEQFDKLFREAGAVTPQQQADLLSNVLGLDSDSVLSRLSDNDEKSVSKGDAFATAQMFLKSADDFDIVDEFERLNAKRKSAPSSFTEADMVMLSQLEDRYVSIKYAEDSAAAESICKQNGVDFKALINDTDFADFAKDLNLPISKAVAKWIKVSGAKSGAHIPVSTGSAKDTGGNMQKDYYSRDEVAKMSPEEIRKNLDIIHKSQSKW